MGLSNVASNCLFFALRRRFEEIWRVLWWGRIDCELLQKWPPKLRFYYVAPDGSSERYEPIHPKKGWAAVFHCWFEGRVRRGRR